MKSYFVPVFLMTLTLMVPSFAAFADEENALGLQIEPSCTYIFPTFFSATNIINIKNNLQAHFYRLMKEYPHCDAIKNHYNEFKKFPSYKTKVGCKDELRSDGVEVGGYSDSTKNLIMLNVLIPRETHERILTITLRHEIYHRLAGPHSAPFSDFVVMCEIAMDGWSPYMRVASLTPAQQKYAETICACGGKTQFSERENFHDYTTKYGNFLRDTMRKELLNDYLEGLIDSDTHFIDFEIRKIFTTEKAATKAAIENLH